MHKTISSFFFKVSLYLGLAAFFGFSTLQACPGSGGNYTQSNEGVIEVPKKWGGTWQQNRIEQRYEIVVGSRGEPLRLRLILARADRASVAISMVTSVEVLCQIGKQEVEPRAGLLVSYFERADIEELGRIASCIYFKRRLEAKGASYSIESKLGMPLVQESIDTMVDRVNQRRCVVCYVAKAIGLMAVFSALELLYRWWIEGVIIGVHGALIDLFRVFW